MKGGGGEFGRSKPIWRQPDRSRLRCLFLSSCLIELSCFFASLSLHFLRWARHPLPNQLPWALGRLGCCRRGDQLPNAVGRHWPPPPGPAAKGAGAAAKPAKALPKAILAYLAVHGPLAAWAPEAAESVPLSPARKYILLPDGTKAYSPPQKYVFLADGTKAYFKPWPGPALAKWEPAKKPPSVLPNGEMGFPPGAAPAKAEPAKKPPPPLVWGNGEVGFPPRVAKKPPPPRLAKKPPPARKKPPPPPLRPAKKALPRFHRHGDRKDLHALD